MHALLSQAHSHPCLHCKMYNNALYIHNIREKLDHIESMERNHSMIIKATTNLCIAKWNLQLMKHGTVFNDPRVIKVDATAEGIPISPDGLGSVTIFGCLHFDDSKRHESKKMCRCASTPLRTESYLTINSASFAIRTCEACFCSIYRTCLKSRGGE